MLKKRNKLLAIFYTEKKKERKITEKRDKGEGRQIM